MRGVDVVEDDFGFKALGVSLESLHQLGALHAHCIGRPVVHLGGGGQLPAGCKPGQQHRFEVGARGIDCGGVAGGAGTQDEQADMAGGLGHENSLSEEVIWMRKQVKQRERTAFPAPTC